MTRVDLFAAFNAVLFLCLAAFRYRARFIQYRGDAHLEEFFIYGAVILAAISLLWWAFRRRPLHLGVLILLQIGILMHFAGAFVRLDAGRLYDAYLLGTRYDKYVHVVNAFAAATLVSKLFAFQRIPPGAVTRAFLVLVVLGMGAVVEIVEYLVLLTIPANGVGGYHNNMQDLIANLTGVLGFLALAAVREFPRLRARSHRSTSLNPPGRRSTHRTPPPASGTLARPPAECLLRSSRNHQRRVAAGITVEPAPERFD